MLTRAALGGPRFDRQAESEGVARLCRDALNCATEVLQDVLTDVEAKSRSMRIVGLSTPEHAVRFEEALVFYF